MKTKHLLFSTIFVAGALASCTNEDFVENGAVELAGEKVNVAITATKGGVLDAETRIGFEVGEDGSLAGTPYWQSTDKLGGLLFTNADGSGMLTNYPFIPTEEIAEGDKPAAMTFKTPTAVSKGTYVFYTPYDGKYVNNKEFTTELADRQEMDPANPTAHLSANNFMISPVVSLEGIPYEEEGAVNELPIQFKSIYNYTRLKITLKEAQAPVTIQRIVFKDANPSPTAFNTKAKIVPSKIAELVAGVTENWSDGKATSLTEVLASDGASGKYINASKAIASDYELAANKFETAILNALVDQTAGASAITLSIKGGVTLNAGESFNAYVLLPYGTYNDGISYDIYSDKGVTESQVIKPSAGNLSLKAGRTASASCELNYTLNNNDFKTPETFDISSDQDWADAVAFVTENYNLYGNSSSWNTPTFNLLKDVKGTLPAFKITVAGNGNKLTLTGDNKLTAATLANGALTDVDVINEGTLTVEKYDATNTAYTLKSLVNKGTVTVNGNLSLTTTLKNEATFTNNGKVTVTATTTNGNATSKPAAVLTNNGAFIANGALTNEANATINVNYVQGGSFTLSAASTNSAKASIVIADKAELTASAAALTNAGTITLNGTASLKGGTTLDNENGIIVIADASKDYKLTLPASGKAGIIKTSVATLAGIKAAQAKVDALTANKLINRIELTASIQVEGDLNMTVADLSLAAGVELEINNNKTVTCKNLVIAGAGVSVAAYDKAGTEEEPAAKLTAGSVTVEEGGSFVNNEGVTIGDACTALTVGKNASLTNNGDINAGVAETDVTVKVAANGKLTIGETGTMTNAKLNITENAGTITNASDTEIKVAGKMVGNMSGKFSFQ